MTDTEDTDYVAAHGRIHKLPKRSLRLPDRAPPLWIERKQSTLVAETGQPTKLSYTIHGGKPPYKLETACWIDGQTPPSVQIHEGSMQGQTGTVTYTPEDFAIVARIGLSTMHDRVTDLGRLAGGRP